MASHRHLHGWWIRSSAVIALAAFGYISSPGLQASWPSWSLEGPFTYANLTVYVVRGAGSDAHEYITLDEGLAARTVAVREKGARSSRDQAEVNTLEIDNRSDRWLFLQAGDIVKGGKQDRTIMTDLTLPPHSGPQPLEAFCVEHGRWTSGSDGSAFLSSPAIVAGSRLKIAIQGEKSQRRVWDEVANAEKQAVQAARVAGAPSATDAKLSSTGTYNAIAENKALRESGDRYVTALLPHVRRYADAIGLAVAVNGAMSSADVYASPALFRRLAGKLLNSYALEALLVTNAAGKAAVPTRPQAIAFLSKPATAGAVTETVGRSMQRATRETPEAVMYEYGRVIPSANTQTIVVHQTYLKK